MNPVKALTVHGQAIWLDFLARGFIANGELRALVDQDGVRGVTSNPSIFEKAIGGSDEYDGAISALLGTYAMIFSQRGVKAFGPVPAYFVRMAWLAAAWVGLQLLIGFAGGYDSLFGSVAIGAHIGGFLAGLLLARPLLAHRFRRA